MEKDKADLTHPTNQNHVIRTPFNFISVGWITSILWKGAKAPLMQEDLLILPNEHLSTNLSHHLDKFWNEFKSGRKPSLLKAMWPHYGRSVIALIFFQLCSVGCTLTLPTFLQNIIYLLSSAPQSLQIVTNGLGLSFLIASLQVFVFVFQQTSAQIGVGLQIDLKTILIGSIYEKALKLSQASSREFTQGQILNSINVDVEKVSNMFVQVGALVTAPVQVIVSIILLNNLIGYSVWGGAGTLFALLLLMISVTGFVAKFQKQFLSAGDRRLKVMREVLYGMKIIKFRALEEFFRLRIGKIRDEQLTALRKYYWIQGYLIGLIQIAPISMPLSAFILYASIHGGISGPAIIFPALSLFQGLFQPILTIPQAITALKVATVSWERISSFLLAEEVDPSISETGNYAAEADGLAIVCKNASFRWEKVEKQDDKAKSTSKKSVIVKVSKSEGVEVGVEEKGFEISELQFSIKRGSKVAIVGAVGSGKSSLLSGLIGEMPQVNGERVKVNGTLSYSAQQPWILTDTIEGNIIFNQPLDKARLDKVVSVCALDADLNNFPAGLQTGIGEKGINLSGGQKARVALARALYFNPDIVLLDDPISALDAQVGRFVFDNAIKGYLESKTVILVTHQLHLLPDMDDIIVLDQGKIVEQGSYKTLISSKSFLADLMKGNLLDEKEGSEITSTEEKEKTEVEIAKKGGIILEEDKETGSVSSKVFWHYFDKCGGSVFVISVIVAAVSNSACQVATNYWLSCWTSNKFAISVNSYMLVYGFLGLGQFICALFINNVFLVGCYHGVKYYHPKALESLLRSPMGFFDSQPIGRILNRMSKDIESIDQNLWILTFLATISFSGAVSSLAFLCYVDQRMLVLAVPLIILNFFMLKYYQRSNIEFRRFESTNRSPLYAHVSETMAGISTLKAYGVERSFIEKQRRLMDVSNRPTYLRMMAAIWIGLRLGVLSCSLTLLLCILGTSSLLESSLVGLSLTYAIGFAGQLSLLLLSTSQLENEFNSVERLSVYCDQLQQEAPTLVETDPAPENWPSLGSINFNAISLSYPSRPDVAILKRLSFSVKAGEKVGVIGRTGSGKSTIMTALFRLVELSEGSIEIDGIGLKTLRSSMQIIPQEPVLFSGNIRENLDVESLYPDADIWDVLERIGLKEYVSSLSLKLSSPVVENGENLSVGQRQLICLGRAILMKPKILVLDEATASVDFAADLLIQASIKTSFQATTVLSIAHRLNTIIDFDRVLVLADGEKVEFDTPRNLLSNPDSLFSKLADATGASNSALLRTACN